MYGMNMAYGPWTLTHWAFFALFVVLVLFPIGRILSRIGFSPLWSIIAFIPVLNLAGLWVLALTDWPRRRVDDGD